MADTSRLLKRADKAGPFCDPECEGRCRECPDELIRDMKAEIARLAAKPAEERRGSGAAFLTDRELYDNSCITRHQLKNWVDSDYAAHVAGLKHTIEFLLARLDALTTTGQPKP